MVNLTVKCAMDIIRNAEENAYSGEYFDLANSLGWLQRAIKENPTELVAEIDKVIGRLEGAMIDEKICPSCGGKLYDDKDGVWQCERCGDRY